MEQNGLKRSSHDTKLQPLSRKVIDGSGQNITDYVDLNQLPSFTRLREKVQVEINSSTWFDRYGVDWIIHISGVLGWFLSHFLIASSQTPVFILGVFVLGCCHSILSLKAGHNAIHGATSPFNSINNLMTFFLGDFISAFSKDVGYKIHIKCHHPHTNVIGLGDSSTWKVPVVPAVLYMFVTPLLLPILTPLVAIRDLWTDGLVFKLVRFLLIAAAGFTCHIYLLTTVSNLTITSALLVIFVSRNILSIPYIHVNIFQHIGLPMYSQKHRPVRLYQMYTGVLNLPRNLLLDYCFGHGIVSCHVEHHLFPQLSDNMCLKIKPIVSAFCKEHDLPYHEDSYIGRTKYFTKNYQELMVNAPPITSFVGLQ